MICQEQDRKIQKWIEENREKMVGMWLDLIRIPSVRGETAPAAPFGADCARALKKATEYATEMGLDTRLEAERGYSLSSYGHGEKVIGVFGHSDVVPAGDGWLHTQPFDPIIRDGVVIGRGCSDNKSGVMAALFAAQIIKECQLPLKSRLQVYVGSNEESGMADMVSFVENEEMPDICLVPDAKYPCSLGEKGQLKQWNQCNTPLVDILDFSGGSAFNVVLDSAKVTLKYTPDRMEELVQKVRDNDAFTLERTSEGHILLNAKGASKHAAYPEGSVNAAILACALLAECACLCETDRHQMQTVVQLMESYYGEGLGIAFEEPGFNKLTCTNGMVKVENGKLSVSLDIRYGAGMSGEKLETLLDKAWETAGWVLTYRVNDHGAKVDPDSPIPTLLTQVTCEVTGEEYQPYWIFAGTYSRHLRNSFTVGSTVHDPNSKAVLLQLPAGHGGAHQRDEVCAVDDFLLGVRLLTNCILACDRAINP